MVLDIEKDSDQIGSRRARWHLAAVGGGDKADAVPERREVRFSLDAREAPAGVIRELARLVREFPGESPVYLSLDTSEGPKTYALGPEYRVRPDPDFIAEARAVLGGSAVLA